MPSKTKDEALTAYEAARQANIKANTELLLSLGIGAGSGVFTRAEAERSEDEEPSGDEREPHKRGRGRPSKAKAGEKVMAKAGGKRKRGASSPDSDDDDSDGESESGGKNTPNRKSRRTSTTAAAGAESQEASASPLRRSTRRRAAPKLRTGVQSLRASRRRGARRGAGSGSDEDSDEDEDEDSDGSASVDSDSDSDSGEEEALFQSRVHRRLASSSRRPKGHKTSTTSRPRRSGGLLRRAARLGKRLHDPKTFGSIPGVRVGDWWPTRMACSTAAVHTPTVAGISGNSVDGCYSLCLSGGYEDDVDLGEGLTYTGSGGRDLKGTLLKPKNLRTAPQSSDQSFGNGLNASLVRSEETQKPVRVVRGYKGKRPYAPPEGYVYSGLYRVERHWRERGLSGLLVCRYVLRRVEGQEELPVFLGQEEEGEDDGEGGDGEGEDDRDEEEAEKEL